MNSRKPFSRTFFGGMFLCIVTLFLMSCENFIKGPDLKRDLEEAIEIANSSFTTFIVTADEGSGTVKTPSLQLKKKYSFEVIFEPAESYNFVKWEVRDRKTKKIVDDVIKFDNPKAVETKGKVIAPRDGLEIYAKCVKLPQIISHAPASSNESNYANIPIILNFNMPMPETTKDGKPVFTYDFISLTCDGANIAYLFYEPVLNNSKTSLTIMPKAAAFSEYILDELKVSHVMIAVSISPQLAIEQNGEKVSFVQNAHSSFMVKYIADMETDPPEEVQGAFFVSRPADKDKPEKYFDITKEKMPTSNYNSFVLLNRAVDKILIYGKYTDEKSGVRTVKVEEVFNDGYNDNKYYVTYDSKSTSAEFIENGTTTEFFIEHELKSGAGVVNFTVTVIDACGNQSSVKKFIVIKVSSEDFNLSYDPGPPRIYPFDVYNYIPYAQAPYSFENNFNYDNYIKSDLKRIIINGEDDSNFYYINYLQEKIYEHKVTIDKENFNIYCEYINSKNTLVTEKFEVDTLSNKYRWYLDLDVENVAGLSFNIIIEDDIGNIATKHFHFPSEPIIVLENQKLKAYYKDFEEGDDEYWIKQKNGEITYYDPYYNLEDGYTYQAIPTNGKLISKISSPFVYDSTASESITQIEWGTVPVDYSPGQKKEGKLNVTLTIKDNSYDMVYCTNSLSGSVPVYFPSNSKQLLTQIDTADAYSNNITYTVYGIKGHSITSASTTKPKLTSEDIEFDNVPPKTYNYFHIYYDVFSFGILDYETGAKSASFIKNDGSKDSTLKKLNTLAKKVDNAENPVIETFEMPTHIPPVIKSIEPQADSKWTFIHYPKAQTISRSDYSYYEWNNGWEEMNVETGVSSDDYDVIINGKKFIKILYSADFCSKWGNPQYFYFTTDKNELNSGCYDYIESFQPGVMRVVSDAPTYVETIITLSSYRECKNWTLEEWETFHRREGGRYYPFVRSENPTPGKYNIPMDIINQIEGHCCYVVVAYFADGTSFMTPVMQK